MGMAVLFNDVYWHGVQESQREKIRSEISSLNKDQLLNSTLDTLTEYFIGKYTLEVPEVAEDKTEVDQKEKEIDVTGDPGRYWRTPGPHYIKGVEISVFTPFTGDPEFFKIQPSCSNSCHPYAEISNQSLILRISGLNLAPEKVKADIAEWRKEIRFYLDNLRSDVEAHNSRLAELIRPQIEARRTKLLTDQNLLAEIGIPIRQREGTSLTYVAPQVRKKITPTLPAATNKPFKPEPTLSIEDYEHILSVLQNMALVMERSPSAFKTIDEEGLRTHFLVQLNGQFEGAATGETFNYQGKTDILVRIDGKNIFIGECKYWGGPQKLKETLDQLLSYSSWRDTKVAAILFNRNKNFSAILKSIPEVIKEHPNYRRTLPIKEETWFRYVIAHKDDPNREMILTVMAFNVPSV